MTEERSTATAKCAWLRAGCVLALLLSASVASAQGWDDRPSDSNWDPPRDYDRRYDDRDARHDERDARYDDYAYDDRRGFGIRIGVGLTAGPDTFLMDFALPYSVGSGVSIGPRVQLGLDENETFLAPTLSIEYAHDLSRDLRGPLAKVRPLINIGVGLAWIERNNRPGDDSDTGFLFDVGLGVAYALSDQFEIASVVDFDILPRSVLGQDLVVTWQALQMRVRF